MKFSILDDDPAWPPGPSRSRTTVETPSEAAYTAAASPAGPAPIIARSRGAVGQSLQTPASLASARSSGLIKRRPSPNLITGDFCGDPQPVSSFCPSLDAESYQVNGTKFLNRNSRTSIVSRHFPGPTTFSPTMPVCVKTTAFLSRNQHRLAEMRQFVQHLSQPPAWNPQQPCVPPCDAAYDHRPARQQVDISCKLAGTVCHDVPILVGGIQDLDGTGFDDK